jgi:hypothetical protein
VSASEPPELPEPEIEYRRPAWIEPPADVVPGIVPVELIQARTPQRAIGLTGIRAYPTGFGCTLWQGQDSNLCRQCRRFYRPHRRLLARPVLSPPVADHRS